MCAQKHNLIVTVLSGTHIFWSRTKKNKQIWQQIDIHGWNYVRFFFIENKSNRRPWLIFMVSSHWSSVLRIKFMIWSIISLVMVEDGINYLNIMPRLHLRYDEYTMPVRCPNHRFRVASTGRPCDHHTDLRASWPLRFCLTPHNDKFEKIVSL